MGGMYVRMTTGDYRRLRELATRELRDPRAQAVLLILEGLRRAGLPEPDEQPQPRPFREARMSDRLAAAFCELEAAVREAIANASSSATPEPERALSVPEACGALGGISRSTLYELIRSEQLATIKVGQRRRVVPAGAIRDFVSRGNSGARP